MQKILVVDRYEQFLVALAKRYEGTMEVLAASRDEKALECLGENSDIGLVVICPDMIGSRETLSLIKDIRKENAEMMILVLGYESWNDRKFHDAGCNVSPRGTSLRRL